MVLGGRIWSVSRDIKYDVGGDVSVEVQVDPEVAYPGSSLEIKLLKGLGFN